MRCEVAVVVVENQEMNQVTRSRFRVVANIRETAVYVCYEYQGEPKSPLCVSTGTATLSPPVQPQDWPDNLFKKL